jgi:hypothetical protein
MFQFGTGVAVLEQNLAGTALILPVENRPPEPSA